VLYCGSLDVALFSQVTYAQVGFASQAALDGWVQGTLISKCQDIIDHYVSHNFYLNHGTIRLDGSGKETQLITGSATSVYGNQAGAGAGNPIPVELLPLPLITVTGVNIDGVAQTATDFQTYKSYVTYEGNVFCSGRQNVDIIGTWGYGTYPHDVQYVTAQIAANCLSEMVRRRMIPDIITPILERGIASDRVISMILRTPLVFTQNEREILNKYRYYSLEVA
jgi:hypothetical protein